MSAPDTIFAKNKGKLKNVSNTAWGNPNNPHRGMGVGREESNNKEVVKAHHHQFIAKIPANATSLEHSKPCHFDDVKGNDHFPIPQ